MSPDKKEKLRIVHDKHDAVKRVLKTSVKRSLTHKEAVGILIYMDYMFSLIPPEEKVEAFPWWKRLFKRGSK